MPEKLLSRCGFGFGFFGIHNPDFHYDLDKKILKFGLFPGFRSGFQDPKKV